MPVGSVSSGGRHPGRQETTDNLLTPTQASAFARLALANVEREFPNKLDHVMASAADVAPPRALHPAFEEDVPYAPIVVEMDEGVRVVSQMVDCAPADSRMDMPVEAVYEDVTPEVTLVKFRRLT